MRCRMICGSPIFLHFYWPLSHVKLRSLAAPWRTPQRSCPALRRGPSADPPPPLREEGRHRTGLGRRSPCRLNVQDGSDGSVAIRCLFKEPQLKPTGLILVVFGHFFWVATHIGSLQTSLAHRFGSEVAMHLIHISGGRHFLAPSRCSVRKPLGFMLAPTPNKNQNSQSVGSKASITFFPCRSGRFRISVKVIDRSQQNHLRLSGLRNRVACVILNLHRLV